MSDWKNIIKGLAPTIATTLGGPLAGTAVKFIGSKLLGDDSANESDIERFMISASPEDLAKVKQLETDFKIEMKRLDVDVIKLSVDNTKSAREMAKVNMWPQIWLSVIFVVGYFAIVLLIASGIFDIPDSMRDTLILLIGIMSREMPTIMQFWFGSSFGSKKKTEQIANEKPI